MNEREKLYIFIYTYKNKYSYLFCQWDFLPRRYACMWHPNHTTRRSSVTLHHTIPFLRTHTRSHSPNHYSSQVSAYIHYYCLLTLNHTSVTLSKTFMIIKLHLNNNLLNFFNIICIFIYILFFPVINIYSFSCFINSVKSS